MGCILLDVGGVSRLKCWHSPEGQISCRRVSVIHSQLQSSNHATGTPGCRGHARWVNRLYKISNSWQANLKLLCVFRKKLVLWARAACLIVYKVRPVRWSVAIREVNSNQYLSFYQSLRKMLETFRCCAALSRLNKWLACTCIPGVVIPQIISISMLPPPSDCLARHDICMSELCKGEQAFNDGVCGGKNHTFLL